MTKHAFRLKIIGMGKKNPVLSFFKFVISLVLVIVLLVVALALFCMVDRKSALSVLPRDYAAYVHTDSVWGAVEPLLDLQAAEVLLSSSDFVQYRQPFMMFRASPLRQNKVLSFLASRAVDAALYDGGAKQHFVAVLNMSFLSFATRPLKWYASLLDVRGLSFVNDDFYFLQYESDGMTVFVKPYKNLVIASDDLQLFMQAFQGDNDASYTPQERALLTKKSDESVRVVVDAAKLVGAAAEGDALLEQLASLLDKDILSVVSFDITDEEIKVRTEIPLASDRENPTALDALIARNSTMPALITRMSDIVQYYTILNAGTLSQLKEAVFPLIPPGQDADGAWKTADRACRTLFSLSAEDLLFSWSGKEFAVLGVEGQTDPVFVVQVTDEKQRQAIFEKITSSFLVNDDTSLILGGVRLPKLVFPGFIQKLLSLFGVSLPSPYYMVQDGFIYFSESSESLSALYTTVNDGRRLSRDKNWNAVSKNQKADATVSLYYDLEHSVPFFLRGDDDVKRILKLYTIGRADMRLKNAVLSCQLDAVARRSGDLREIPGFPIATEKLSDGELQAEYQKNPEAVFWVENGNTIKSLEFSSMKQSVLALPDDCTIVASPAKQKGNGVLWAVTSHGGAYLLTRDLQTVSGFPVILNETPTAPSAVSDGKLVVPVQTGLLFVTDGGKVTFAEHTLGGAIKAAPSVSANGKLVGVYDKGFAGKILLAADGSFMQKDGEETMTVSGIAYGSPAVMGTKDNAWVAFVTQAGNLYLWHNGALLDGFPTKLDGIFYTNAVASEQYFYVLSDTAVLYRIAKDGSYTSVAIPNATAKNAFLTVTDARTKGTYGIYVCADGNMIYGFKENLEMISGFPVAGWGRPVFADVNGDKNIDVLALTMDKKIVGWNLR